MKTEVKPNRNKVNWLVDLVIFVAFLVAAAPNLTGLAIHEWLGVAFGAAIITHLLLHWNWIVGVTKQLFGKAQRSSKLNYLLNVLLFITMTVITFTGLMISETVMAQLGIEVARERLWSSLHHLASDFSVFLIGAHIALHWHWIVNMVKKYVLRQPAAPQLPKQSATAIVQQPRQKV